MEFILVLVLIAGAFAFGRFWGISEQKDKEFRDDPDNDEEGSKDGNLQLLLFTKKARYNYGRALAIGTKEEIARTKKELEDSIENVKNIAMDVAIEKYNRERQNK